MAPLEPNPPLEPSASASGPTSQPALLSVDGSGNEHASVLTELDKLQNKSTNWTTSLLMLVVSLIAFIALGRAWMSWTMALMLIGILLFHELGHFVTMKLFRYRNTRMFFIPLFGAAVTGQHYNVPGWKKVVVSLMGPVPGIWIGFVIGMLGVLLAQQWLLTLAVMTLILNGFNLLPVLPLDGGWVLHTILFCRHSLLDVAFRSVACLCLFLLGLAFGDHILTFLGVAMALGLPLAFKTSRIVANLRHAGWSPRSEDDQSIPHAAASQIIARVKSEFPQGMNDKQIAQISLNVFESLNASPPGWIPSSAFLALHATSFLAAAVGTGTFLFASQGGFQEDLLGGGPLSRRKLATVFVDRQVGRRGDVETVGQAVDGDFDHAIQEPQDFVIQPQTFVADHQNRPPLEPVFK